MRGEVKGDPHIQDTATGPSPGGAKIKTPDSLGRFERNELSAGRKARGS
jgi:hypothetical protein